ncbi:pimeloyl-ACP methyl ester carboxylesterase [Marmoricola sp. OAE513]|uniref:alpha/beta hydrolase n=1 Tax=Marmoricola sp. OAE513 TaxID=2817894 RepID=UPI001AE31C80
MKRVVAALAAVVLVGSLAGLTNVAAASDQVKAGPAFTPTVAAWKNCGDLQCSTLTVPMDYAHPDNGKTVKLAITRLAADPLAGAYAGIMVVNPGGPGGAGTPYPVLREYVPGTAAKRYDWIGFDPRGVGASTPALHCNANYFGNNRPNFVPKTKKLKAYWFKKTAGYATACSKSTAKDLLPFMTTRDSARDMETLRQALHDAAPALNKPAVEKFNFYGFSYGTYLGAVYATLYPSKVGRFVLDGVVDPARYWYGSNFDQSKAFDKNINIFFRWMAKHDKVFHLGKNGSKIRAGYNKLLKKLDKHPKAGGRLGPDELTDAMLSAGYYVYDWASIGSAYSKLVRKGQGYPLYSMYRSGNQGADNDNGYAVYLGVQCTDQRRPSKGKQVKDTWRVHKKAPFLAWDNTWYNMPCLTWRAPSRGKVPITGAGLGATKILLISETKDAATPYSGALNLRNIFKGSALIAGVGGTTHAGSLSGVACVDNRIASYLATGALPTRQSGRRSDLNCPAVPRPPASSAGRSTAKVSTGVPTGLRALLTGTQRISLG